MNPAAPVTRVRIISYLLDGELRTAATEVRGGIGDDSAGGTPPHRRGEDEHDRGECAEFDVSDAIGRPASRERLHRRGRPCKAHHVVASATMPAGRPAACRSAW